MLYTIPNKEYGCREFGWQNEMYDTIEDKLNWCGIILLSLYAACRNADFKAAWTDSKPTMICKGYEDWRNKFIKWKEMLEKVCKERLGFGVYLDLGWLKLYGATDENSWQAYVDTFNCYIDQTGSASARELTFTFEEADGTTTAIRAISVDKDENSESVKAGWYTIGGMKLQGAPAQKGIYIHNGKKIVVK